MNEPLRVYLVGAGVIARHHAAATAKLPVAVSLHVTDLNAGAGEDFLKQFPSAIAHRDLPAMLAVPAQQDDIAIVATPPFAHFDATIAALRSGRHVLCEKPLAMDCEQAVATLEEAKQRGKLLGCCSSRFLC